MLINPSVVSRKKGFRKCRALGLRGIDTIGTTQIEAQVTAPMLSLRDLQHWLFYPSVICSGYQGELGTDRGPDDCGDASHPACLTMAIKFRHKERRGINSQATKKIATSMLPRS